MKSTISRILQEIENKRKELAEEYERIKKKYNFEYIKRKKDHFGKQLNLQLLENFFILLLSILWWFQLWF